ncbi:YIP3-like protein [Taphrina deformans PYCC 5710]|uniref:PRA1 family protein n=1 Tax=Taphrina deformans (strain PYCC 5710 / ATCC 11124 / CBS 356.35 / IMI 108563 / JCM 9778 / NBRC 8474) TaxID=1097556 RepID=R4X6P2_TAPDE|nr:YIP3-like protein [Taphrina deformans PYCC 5710]|eukprot:CCG80861.1 YIP3-like protein [Taphrina deformans PYCC 5710]
MNYANVARDALANVGNNFAQIRTSDRFANLRPVQEFLDVRRISKPSGLGEIQQRISYNLGRYSSNYSVIFALLALYALITNPLLLFVIALAVGGMLGIGKLAGENLRIGPIDLTTSQLYTALVCVCVPLGFIASPISTVFWLVGANGLVILGHAALMEPPVESQFEEVGQQV